MASSVQFLERWRSLSDPSTTANERAGNYTVLTSYLKEGGVDPNFTKELCRHQQPLLQRILKDVTCKSCNHAALQALGYCLHNIEFASKFNKEQVNSTIKGLREVIVNGNTEKSVCTRALWCLTNQQLPADHMTNHVTPIITMATEVVTVHQVGVATVSSEALNLLVRFGQQFPSLFTKLVPTWYKAIVELLICKVHKIQHKALGLAISYEAQLQTSHEATHWLTKILKERVVSVMLTQLTERGQDHAHLLKSWAHFVTILGKTLHKHGSFLNELLRVVETGFKHRTPQVQIAAYDAWKTLITNFALDLSVMTSPKRLKLLMMPLLASAVRERHDTVEQARIQTWWHLIGRLGHCRESQFKQVCVPFLLLCLGLDPKFDISQLPESIGDIQSHSHSSVSDSKSLSDSNNAQTPKSSSNIHLAVTPTPTSASSGAPPTSATPTCSRKHGCLLSAINTPRSRGGVEIEKGRRSSDRYQAPPNVAMVMTGCHALLEFTGGRDEFPHSFIKSDPGLCVIFPKLIVPMETAQFMLLFLDALLTYATELDFKEKGISLDLILHHIVTVITSSIEAEDGVSPTLPTSAALLVPPLVDLVHSDSLTDHLCRQMRMDVLSQLSSLSPRLLLSTAGGRRSPSDCWRRLTSELLNASKPEQTSDWFNRNWLTLTDMVPSTSMPLINVLFLSNELSRLVKEGSMERETCSTLWTSLAKKLTSFISQTSEINSGTSVDPNFEPIRQILKLPFLHLLDNGERSHVTSVMDVWKSLYETANVHMGLVVKEMNLCAELVCSDLYSAYGQYMKQVPSSLDQKHQVLRFDLYQNAVASALSYVVSKIKWGTLVPAMGGRRSKEQGGGGRVKSVETLLSLLAWQLAAFWDTAHKGPMQLSQLTTPYTLLDVVESLYHHVTSSTLITMATEMIGQPLATLFEAILNSSLSQPSNGRSSRMTQQDIEHRVEKVWKAITICFQSRHAHPFDSALLSTLSPLLVATLNCSNQQLSNLAMSFWAVTFDKAKTLEYPARLRDYFVKYLKDLKQPSELKLPGLSGSTLTLTSAQKELISTEDSSQLGQSEVIQFSDTQSHSQSQNQDPDILVVDMVDSVVLPNPSPQKKGVCGSFLNRPPMADSPLKKPRPCPSSPQAKQLDEILARSATTMERVQSSPLRGVGVANDGKRVGSPLASARRRLDLGSDKEEYVSVGPPVKKRRLLTEHQEEVMRERRPDLPTLYNALDPTLDSAPITMATLDQSTQHSNEADPIVSESEDHLPPTSDDPTSVPDSIPIPRSRSTSRDAPITIPDSPPLTPPPLFQQAIAMATMAPSSTVSKNTDTSITKASVNPLPVVTTAHFSVNPSPVVTTRPPSTMVNTIGRRMLEINQSLINATAQLHAQTTLALSGGASLPSQPTPPQPPSLTSISNQPPHLSSMSSTSHTRPADSVSITQANSVPPVQGNSTTATVQTSSTPSTAVVQARGVQIGSISTSVQDRSVSMSLSPSPPSSTTSSVVKPPSSRTIPGPAGFLQPASLTDPEVLVSGTLRSAVSVTVATQSQNKSVAASISTQSHGAVMASSTLQQHRAISTGSSLPLTHYTGVSLTHTRPLSHDPVPVASSFAPPPHINNNFPHSLGTPLIISQPGQGSMIQYVQLPAPQSVVHVQPTVGQVVQARVGQNVPPPRGQGMPAGVFGQVMSTGVGQMVPPRVLAQVMQPRVRAVGQMIQPPLPRLIQGAPPGLPPPVGRIPLPGFPPGSGGQRVMPQLVTQGVPPPPPRIIASSPHSPVLPHLVTQGVQVGIPLQISQGMQIGVPHVASQSIQAVNNQGVSSGTKVVIASSSGQQNNGLPSHSKASLNKNITTASSSHETHKTASEEQASAKTLSRVTEPEVRRRGRPRKLNQEDGEQDGTGDRQWKSSLIQRGRGRPRKQSHDHVNEECTPGNQREGEEEDDKQQPRKRGRKRKSISATASDPSTANEVTESDVLAAAQVKKTIDVAAQSVQPAYEQEPVEIPTTMTDDPLSSSSAKTMTTSVITSSNKSMTSETIATATSSTLPDAKTSNEDDQKSMAEGGTNIEKIVESDNIEIEQNASPEDNSMDVQSEGDLTSNNDVPEDSEDPLSGLKSKKKRETVSEEGGELEKREELEGAESKAQAGSPELIVMETEVDCGEMDTETRDSSDTTDKSKSREDKSNSGTELLESDTTQESDPKLTTSEAQSTEPSNSTTSDRISKVAPSTDKTTSSSRDSNGGRKSLSLRRHSSTSVGGEGVSGEGDAGREGGGGEREETATAGGGGSRKPSLVDTPTNGKGGILKHTSQFDSPSTAKAGRRVQFATKPVFHELQSQQPKEEEPSETVTPKQSRSSRTPSGSFSSRRTLMMSQTPPKMILVNKPHPPATPPQNTGPIYPSLRDCQSPVEQILPALSPSSQFTHGLLKLVSAQNITTVGSISSLSEHEVQTLPIKSPKVQTLRGALRSFEQQLQGSKRRSSVDSEASLTTPPPRKQPRLDSDLLSSASSSTSTTAKDASVGSKMTSDPQKEQVTGTKVATDGSLEEKEVNSSHKDRKSQEAKNARSLKTEDTVSMSNKAESNLTSNPLDRQEKDKSGHEEAQSQEASSGEVSNSASCPHDGQEKVKSGHEEEPKSQEAESSEIQCSSASHSHKGRENEVKSDREEDKSQEADSEELSERSCDMNVAMITLCTPESQLTQPDDTVDQNETIDQGEQKSKKAREEITDAEKMDVDESHSKTAQSESHSSPPSTTASEPELQPQALSIHHDHPYCSQKTDDSQKDGLPTASLNREENNPGSSAEGCRDSRPSHKVFSTMVHDHTYCSQQSAEESADNAKATAKTGDTVCDKENIGSKLSLMVHDHTYCSNTWPEPERSEEPCLMETSPEHHEDENKGLAKESGGERVREKSTTAMDEGSLVMRGNEQDTIAGEERGMDADEAAPVDLDTSADSDVFTEEEESESTVCSSSQSQELFSQQPSQDQLAIEGGDTSTRAETVDTVVPTSHRSRGRKGEGMDQQVSSDESADVMVEKEVPTERLETDRETRESYEDEKYEQETSEVMEKGTLAAGIKGQDKANTGSDGSADSSESSTHTYNAECSQRPTTPSTDSTHHPSPNQITSDPALHPSSSSLDPTNSDKDSSSLMDTLSQIEELHDKLNELLDQKQSLSHREFLACLQTSDKLRRTTTKFGEVYRRNIHLGRSWSNQDASL